MKNNHLNYQLGMYDPSTDSVIVNTSENSVLVIRCRECNATIILNESNDIVYLYRLAQETSLLYAELALKEDLIKFYCKRGLMENFIKESKSGFDFTSVSSHTRIVNATLAP